MLLKTYRMGTTMWETIGMVNFNRYILLDTLTNYLYSLVVDNLRRATGNIVKNSKNNKCIRKIIKISNSIWSWFFWKLFYLY